MIIIFDLDYTLFDTARFKKDLSGILKMSNESFGDSYKKHFKDKGESYNIKKHINVLFRERKIKAEEKNAVQKRVELFFKKSINDYIVKDAEDILKKLKSAGHTLILLSFGDKKFQNYKIKNLDIKKYFSKIIVTDKDKSESLKFLKDKKERILIVNDNAKESVIIKKALKNRAEIFLVQGPYSDNIKTPFKIEKADFWLQINDLEGLKRAENIVQDKL